MKKLLLLPALFVASNMLYAQHEKMPEDYYYETKELQVDSFGGVKIWGAVTVKLDQGTPGLVSLHGKTEQFEHLDIRVERGFLIIKVKGMGKVNKVTITVNIDGLEYLSVAGAATVNSDLMLPANKIRMDFSGACKVNIGIDCVSLDMNVSGASDATVDGEARSMKLDISGASQLKSAQLSVVEAIIVASGASKVDLQVSGKLSASASGASKITYGGDAELTRSDLSGAATIEKAAM
jgi:hypothetical protein